PRSFESGSGRRRRWASPTSSPARSYAPPTTLMSRSLPGVRAYWLAEVPYREAWDLQRSLVDAVRRRDHGGALLLLQHPHVFTIGRRGDGSTLLWSPEEC